MIGKPDYDVLIIGGGPAGLSAAMSLGRMNRTALIVDDNRARNAAAEHMHNFASHEGLNPDEWRRAARRDLERYPSVSFLSASVKELTKDAEGFSVNLSEGIARSFKKIILSHGIEDKLSSIKGVRELWGKSIFHCPYCHGFEIRDRMLGLVGNGPIAEHMLPMIYNLSSDTVLFTNGPIALSDEFQGKIARKGIRIVKDVIQGLSFSGTELEAIRLPDGQSIERHALFWMPTLPYALKSDFGIKLGCELSELGLYRVNDFGKTSVDGVYAAGDVARPMHSVLAAASSGQIAGAAVVSELLTESF